MSRSIGAETQPLSLKATSPFATPEGRQILSDIASSVLLTLDEDQFELSHGLIDPMLEKIFQSDRGLLRTVRRFDLSNQVGGFGDIDWLALAIVPLVVRATDRLKRSLATLDPREPIPESLMTSVITAKDVRWIACLVRSPYARERAGELTETLRSSVLKYLEDIRRLER